MVIFHKQIIGLANRCHKQIIGDDWGSTTCVKGEGDSFRDDWKPCRRLWRVEPRSDELVGVVARWASEQWGLDGEKGCAQGTREGGFGGERFGIAKYGSDSLRKRRFHKVNWTSSMNKYEFGFLRLYLSNNSEVMKFETSE